MFESARLHLITEVCSSLFFTENVSVETYVKECLTHFLCGSLRGASGDYLGIPRKKKKKDEKILSPSDTQNHHQPNLLVMAILVSWMDKLLCI